MILKKLSFFVLVVVLSLNLYAEDTLPNDTLISVSNNIQDSLVLLSTPLDTVSLNGILLEKKLLFDKHTLKDNYLYKTKPRTFQWNKIKQSLAHLETLLKKHSYWGILQNYKNLNGEAPLVKEYHRNAYKRIADSNGVDRYQSVPLYAVNDTTVALLYGRDGTFVKYLDRVGTFVKIEAAFIEGEWLVPQKYFKKLSDTISFNKVIFVDVTNQNIATVEKVDSTWLIRSMNPSTTGLHRPPHQEETPLGIFVVQEHKPKMFFLKDGTNEIGGFAPWASRFCNGGYIHGVPVNLPRTDFIEYSPTLGTTPRSHMCVRNATSHAKFIYDWAKPKQSLVFVLD